MTWIIAQTHVQSVARCVSQQKRKPLASCPAQSEGRAKTAGVNRQGAAGPFALQKTLGCAVKSMGQRQSKNTLRGYHKLFTDYVILKMFTASEGKSERTFVFKIFDS